MKKIEFYGQKTMCCLIVSLTPSLSQRTFLCLWVNHHSIAQKTGQQEAFLCPDSREENGSWHKPGWWPRCPSTCKRVCTGQIRIQANQSGTNSYHRNNYWLFFVFFFFFLRVIPMAYGGSQARDLIRAVAANLHHSHNHTRSEPRLWSTSQLMATLDP